MNQLDVERMINRVPMVWRVSLAVALGPVILIGKDLFQGKVLYWGTPALQFVPWWVEGLRQISEGGFPLWNQLNGMGSPLLANYQTAFFYPPNWLLFLFGAISGAPGIAWGFTFLALLHLIWGGLGMSAFLRRLGAGGLAQAVGGLAFALCGYLIGRMEFISMIWVGAWIPWVLRYADEIASPVNLQKDAANNKWLNFGLIISIAAQLLAGHAQLCWYTLQFAVVWIAFGAFRAAGWKGLGLAVARFAVAGLSAALLASVQLIPTFEYLSQSQRASEFGYQEALTYSYWPWRFLSIFAPDFFGNPGAGNYWGYANYWEDHVYIGLLPVVFVLGSIGLLGKHSRNHSRGWLKQPMVRLLWVIILIGSVFALGKNTPVFPFLYRTIPTFDMFQAPARYMIWVVVAGILLAANQIDTWRYPSGRGLYWLRLGTAGAFAVALGAGVGWLALDDVRLTFVQAVALAGLWALGTGMLGLLTKYKDHAGWRFIWPVLVYGWVLADLLSAGWYLNPMVNSKFYSNKDSSAQDIKELLGDGRIYLSRSDEYFLKFSRFLRFEDYRLYEDVRRLRYALLPNLNLLEGFSHTGNFDPIVPARYAAWLKIVERAPGSRESAMLARMNVSLVERFDAVSLRGVQYIPSQTRYAARWVECAEFQESGTQALLALARRDFRLSVLQIEDPTRESDTCTTFSIQPHLVLSTRSGRLSIQTHHAEPGWLVISQVWFPGWEARIDGQVTKVYRTDYVFMAIEVPAGKHSISLEYKPISFLIGTLLSILILFGMVIAWFYNRRSYRLKSTVGRT